MLQYSSLIAAILLVPGIIALFNELRRTLRLPSKLYIILWLGYPLWRIRNPLELAANPLDNSAILRIAMPSLALLFLIGLEVKRRRLFVNLKKQPLIFIFIFALFAAVSSIYSLFPGYTAFKSFEYLVAILTIAYFSDSTLHDYVQLVKVALLLNILLVFSVAISGALSPTYAFVKMGGTFNYILFGVFPKIDTNTAGVLSSINIILCLRRVLHSTFKKRKYLYTSLILGNILIFLMCQSRTSMISVLIGLIILTIFSRKGRLYIISS